MYTDIRNTRQQATRKGKMEAVTWRAVWSCTSPGTGKQADHPSVQAELGPVRMCGGKWESVEQQQPAEEINMTERYKRSQKLSKAVKNPSISCMSQSAVTIIYIVPLPSPASFPRTAALPGRHCTGTQRLMPARGIWWTWRNQQAPHTEQALTIPGLTCLYSTLKELSPALSTPYLLVKLLIIIDWLENLLKVTSSHTRLSICFS